MAKTLFIDNHWEKIRDYISKRADKYFAYGQPSGITGEDVMRLVVPPELHQLARQVPEYYSDIEKGGTVYVHLPNKTRFTIEVISTKVNWAMPKTIPNEELIQSRDPVWLRIMEWAKWRVEQAHRWDGLMHALIQMDKRLGDPRAALFYMPCLENIVDGVHLPETTRKRWDNAKRRREPTEPLPFSIKQLASEAGMLWTETTLMPPEFPPASRLEVKLHISDYKRRQLPLSLDGVNTIAADEIFGWAINRNF